MAEFTKGTIVTEKRKNETVEITPAKALVRHWVYTGTKEKGTLTEVAQIDTWIYRVDKKAKGAGLKAAKAELTLSHVDDLNRQMLTDAKNDARRGTSVMSALKKLAETSPQVASIVEALATATPEQLETILASFGVTVPEPPDAVA